MPVEPEEPQDPELPCPHCGREFAAWRTVCPHCELSVWEGETEGDDVDLAEPVPGKMGAVWSGILVANLLAMVLVLLCKGFGVLGPGNTVTSGAIPAAEFVVVPMAMGMISAYVWRNAGLTTPEYFGYSFLNSLLALVVSAVFLGEGAICLLIASPLVICFTWFGALIGRGIYPKNNNRLNLSLIPMMLGLVVCDSLTPHHYQNSVVDTVTIHAPPAQVWRYIEHYPKITEAPDYWLFRIGLPSPIQATSTGQFVGADRKCIFTKNVVLDERIVELEPRRKLTFDILTQPKDPEILMHLVLNRGQLVLHDNGNGTTALIGTSWYRLNVYPVCYYDLWTQSIIRHVHLRVMNHMKKLAETAPEAR